MTLLTIRSSPSLLWTEKGDQGGQGNPDLEAENILEATVQLNMASGMELGLLKIPALKSHSWFVTE